MKESRKFSLEKREFWENMTAVWNYLKGSHVEELGLFCVSWENKARAEERVLWRNSAFANGAGSLSSEFRITGGIQVESMWPLDYIEKGTEMLDDSVLSTLWFYPWQLKIFLSKIDYWWREFITFFTYVSVLISWTIFRL